MPTMTGTANLKTYFFPNRYNSGTLLTLQKDSLVYVRLFADGKVNQRHQVYWEHNFQRFNLYASPVGITGNPPFQYLPQSGNFVPSGKTIKFDSFLNSGGDDLYLYVIELDNDEPNA